MTVLLPERGDHLMDWSMAHRKQKTTRREGGQEVCVKPLSWVTLQRVWGTDPTTLQAGAGSVVESWWTLKGWNLLTFIDL